MEMPERGPGPYYKGQEPPPESPPADTRVYREPVLQPVDRERYVQDVRVVERGSILQWGSIWGGLLGAIGLLVVLGLVGLIVGLNRFETGVEGQAGTGSLIWGTIVVLVSFFVGGWIAGRTLSYPASGLAGFITGSIMWSLGITLLVLLAAFGASGAMAAIFGPFGIPNLAPTPGAVGTVQSAATGTLVGLVLTYIVCVLGAMSGAGGARGEYDVRVR